MTETYPDPQNPKYADTRDPHLAKIQPAFLRHLGIELASYQKVFLNPPEPYDIKTLKLVQMGGGKRLGKSFALGIKAIMGTPLPHYQIRLYAPEHENAKREFDHIDYFLFKGEHALAHRWPDLKEQLTDYNADPQQGRLLMRWSWGAEIRSMSWERRNQWVGEPIDLGIICEPGLFPDGTVFSGRIEPNLQDRRGICYSAGTVDNPWMFDYHQLGHNHDENPDIFCVCEIPRWANLHLFESLREDWMDEPAFHARIKQEIDLARERLTARDFAINWEGHWDNYSDIAIENWSPADHVKVVSPEAHANMEKIPPGWDHYLAMDPGGFMAIGEYIVNPRGHVLMINEWCNYEYKAGQIRQVDFQGFADFFGTVLREILARRVGMNRPVLYGDPAWQDKLSVTNQGCGWIDAHNYHDSSVNTFNEYLMRKKFTMIRPPDRGAYMAEREIPRAKWRNDQRRKLDDNTRGHSFDQVRYALGSRPLESVYVPERTLSVIEKDIAGLGGSGPGIWDDSRMGDDGL